MEQEEEVTKKAAERAEQHEKDQVQCEHNCITTAHAVVWSPGWCNRKKDDLKDLCYMLRLSMEGTHDNMVKQVEAHLRDHPSLSSDNQFQGLFVVLAGDNVRDSQVKAT